MAEAKIDRKWVQEYGNRYLDGFRGPRRDLEDELFGKDGPAAAERKQLDLGELLKIARWKAPRSSGHVAKNDVERVKRVTETAFAVADERVLTLTSLHGVGVPLASAILAVRFPERHTVYDKNARWTLRQADRIYLERVDYGLYLATCRQLAADLGPFSGHPSDLRALDRALWQYGHENM